LVSGNRYHGLDVEVVTSVKNKARSLVGYCGIGRGDVEDLEQELIVHLLSEISQTPPGTVSKRQVINRSLKDCVSDMIRAAKAAKRGLGAEKLCLDDEPGSSGSSALDEWLGRCFRHESATRDIARQLAEIRMSSDERALADLLKEASLCEAAERLGISRWRARELVRSIREKWEHAENPPPIQRGAVGTHQRGPSKAPHSTTQSKG